MQRMRLSARVDAAGNQIVTSGEALTLVSTVMRVPQQKIYASDRFGEDVGSLHLFDDILDRLGGRLVLLKKKSGCDLSIEHIRTVGGFAEAWEDCLTRSKADGAH
jgi:hypothetical protein